MAHSAGSRQGTETKQSFTLYLRQRPVRPTADLAARDAHHSRRDKLQQKRITFPVLTQHWIESLLQNYSQLPTGGGSCSRNNHCAVYSNGTAVAIRSIGPSRCPSASRWGLWHKAALTQPKHARLCPWLMLCSSAQTAVRALGLRDCLPSH